MSVPRKLIAISLDQDRLCAIGATVSGKGVAVDAFVGAQAPAGVNMRDAAAVGAWIGAELEKAGLARGKLVIAVPRGEVILKKLKLPRGQESGGAELAGMVKLQMTRQLTMAVEGTAIDYLPIGDAEAVGAGGSVSVLAAALPGERMLYYRELAKAAGCKLERVGLRAAGAAALLAEVSQTSSGPVLGVSVGMGSTEFAVVESGQLVFARAADVGIATVGEGEESFVQRVAVEAKRTAMSYRVGEGAGEVDALLVAGEGALATQVCKACGEAVELPWRVASLPSMIEQSRGMKEQDRLIASPLLGLLAEGAAASRPSLDFAHPRKAPDLNATKRQRALLAVLAAILIGGGGYVASLLQLNRLEGDLKQATEKGASLRGEYSSFLAQDARLNHIKKWAGAKTNWIAHLGYLSEQMPDPRQALMDQVSGNMSARVVMAADKDGKYDPKGWQVDQTAAFAIQGHIKQREIANDLRDRLQAARAVYAEVATQGPDVPDQFSFTLVSKQATPEPDKPAPEQKEKGKDSDAKGGGK